VTRKDILTMSRAELRRLELVKKAIEKEMVQKKVGELLGISERQVRRLVQQVKAKGEEGIIHGLRGLASNRRMDGKIKEEVVKIYKKRYEGFGPTLAVEKLYENEGIKISDETLRLLLIEKGLWKKRRGSRKHRTWRERKAHCGEMVQMDGSHHDWLEGRGPKLVLMGYIDDATGRVYGRFYDYEGTIPALDSFRRYIRKYGIPQSVYLDRHSTYKQGKGKLTIEEELAGVELLSEFERALKELGVEVIHANSPQAKGRVERLFNTMQDRLVKEMRLKGIKSKAEANEFLKGYLPVFNRRFNVEAKEKSDLHIKIGQGVDLRRIFCLKTERTLRNDFTVSYNQKLYQVLDHTKAEKVLVETRLDGRIELFDKDKQLHYKEIVCRPERKIRKKKEVFIGKAGKPWKPPQSHPWRKFRIGAAA
jgi:transposase